MEFTYTNMLAQLNVASAHPGGLAATKKAWNKLKQYPHDVILDAGCGTGKTLEFLTEVTKSHLIGVDQHQEMFKKAQQRLTGKSVELKLADLKNLPFKDHSIDCIISESVVSFNEISPILNEYNRVLRPGGILYLIEITAEQTLTKSAIDQINQFYGTESILTSDQWIDSINRAYFNLIEHSALPAMTDGQADLKIDANLDPIFLDYLSHHFHLIESTHNALIGYQFLCQKNSIMEKEDDNF